MQYEPMSNFDKLVVAVALITGAVLLALEIFNIV